MSNGAQLSYSSGISSVPLLGETIGDCLTRIANLHPEREALVDVPGGRRWTFRQLDVATDELAAGLLARGIEKGDRVGILAPNCGEWVLVQYATAKIGAILVNVNPSYRVDELAFVVEQSGMRMLVSWPGFRTSDYRGMVAEIGFDEAVFIGEETWEGLLTAGLSTAPEALAARRSELDFDDPINIQYTSGTTGFPKGATLSHHNILNNGYFVAEGLAYTPDDRVCLPVPLYHCFGMVMGILGAHTHGASVILPAPAFDAEATLAAAEAEQCTSLYGVPTMFIAELGHPRFGEFDLSSLRTGIMAGSPCPTEIMKRVVSQMGMSEVAICYGMTETSPVATMTARDDALDKRTETVGRVMPHLEVRVAEPETGKVVDRGEVGEMWTRGYSVMIGYWNDDERTREVLSAGWMRTGDMAVMNHEGYVSIVGRIKDMVIRGGENVYPREIEEFYFGHPDIQDVQVIGVPDDHYGEELMAWIVVRPGADPVTVESLRSFAGGRLASYKIPRYAKVVESFPMTVTGKVRKVEMRAIAIDLLNQGALGAEPEGITPWPVESS